MLTRWSSAVVSPAVRAGVRARTKDRQSEDRQSEDRQKAMASGSRPRRPSSPSTYPLSAGGVSQPRGGCWSRTNLSNDICVMDINGTKVVDIASTPNLDENFPSWGRKPE